MPARMGATKPPMLLEAVQKPQKVPRSLSGYHSVRMRAHAGAPSPCASAVVKQQARGQSLKGPQQGARGGSSTCSRPLRPHSASSSQ